MHTKHIVVLGSIVFLLALGAWLYFSSSGASSETHQEFFNKLLNQNQPLSEAEQLSRADRYVDALPLYDAALQQVSGDEQRLQIQLLRARATEFAGDYSEAVSRLKDIVAAEPDIRFVRARATAAAEIASIYSFGNVEVNREIFRDEPFRSLWVEGDVNLTLRHMYEYASSIYPIALSQLRIAQWYAAQLPENAEQAVEDSSLVTIEQLLASADADIAYLRTQDAMMNDLHMALLTRARLLGELNYRGHTSFGDAEEQFESAITAYTSEGSGHDGVARYYYAIFLAQKYGKSRASEIKVILAPLSSPSYAQTSVVNTLTVARNSAFFRQFPLLLAGIDPDFKTYLMTLGWSEADFSS